MGIIKLKNDMIIAIERNEGNLYEVQDSAFRRLHYTPPNPPDNPTNWIGAGSYATGALALWQGTDIDQVARKLLIVGIQGDLYTTTSTNPNGYVEFDLNTNDGSLILNSDSRFIYPDLKSVESNAEYLANLGPVPINHLFQVPEEVDVNMTFFASTQKEGVWSYRDIPPRGLQWNTETRQTK